MASISLTRRKSLKLWWVRMNAINASIIAKRTWAEMRIDDVFGRAPQLAYCFFLALFPFLIFVIATLSVFGTADRGRSLLFAALARWLPAPAFQLIRDTFTEILQSSGPPEDFFGNCRLSLVSLARDERDNRHH